MNICKRIENEFARLNANYRRTFVPDTDVVTAMAQVWVATGGEAGAFDDDYVQQVRDAIERLEKTPLDGMQWEQGNGRVGA